MKSTTLNPLFSEEEIQRQKEHYLKALGESRELWEKIKQNGLPDDVLESARLRVTTSNRKKNYQGMIEANISILNGRKINEVEEKYYKNELNDALESDKAVQEKYKELVNV